jgi:hypothetical protein
MPKLMLLQLSIHVELQHPARLKDNTRAGTIAQSFEFGQHRNVASYEQRIDRSVPKCELWIAKKFMIVERQSHGANEQRFSKSHIRVHWDSGSDVPAMNRERV